MIQHIRWQTLIALSGIFLLVTMLGYFSGTLESIVVPEEGGTYTEGLLGHPANLNPLYLQNRVDQDVAALVFNGLTRPDERGVLQPELAESWRVTDEGKRYTFFLRDDVVWHDGAPFKVEDVAFTVDVLRDPAYDHDPAAADLWRSIEVEIEGQYRISFTLPDELGAFAPFLSFTTFGILPSHLLSGIPVSELPNAPFSRRPVGTGPWRVVRVAPGQIILEPHPAYHKDEEPMLDEIVLRFYDNASSALQALKHGEVMGVAQVHPEEMGTVLTDPDLNPHATTIEGYTALFFNLNHSLFQSQEVREALMLGMDRAALIEEVLDGQGLVADGFLVPTDWAYNPQLPRYGFEPEEALAMLEEAGWEDSDDDGLLDQDGLPLEFTIMTDESVPHLAATASAVARQWRALGVQVETDVVSSGVLARALRQRNFDMVLLSTRQGEVPLDPDFYPVWHSSQALDEGNNYTSFSDEEADFLLVEVPLTMTVEVEPNLPPVAVDDAYTMTKNTFAMFDVLANDSDPDSDPLTITAVGTPGHGDATTDGGMVYYTPTAGYSGTDNFDYTISDGMYTDTATVTVVIEPEIVTAVTVDRLATESQGTAPLFAAAALGLLALGFAYIRRR